MNTQEKIYTCRICDSSFGSIHQLLSHIISHKITKAEYESVYEPLNEDITCLECGRILCDERTLWIHCRSHKITKKEYCLKHKVKKYLKMCPICKEDFYFSKNAHIICKETCDKNECIQLYKTDFERQCQICKKIVNDISYHVRFHSIPIDEYYMMFARDRMAKCPYCDRYYKKDRRDPERSSRSQITCGSTECLTRYCRDKYAKVYTEEEKNILRERIKIISKLPRKPRIKSIKLTYNDIKNVIGEIKKQRTLAEQLKIEENMPI